MKMILHILLKDLRRHRWEVLLFLAVTTGWILQIAHPSGWIRMHASAALPITFFAVWLFLVIRFVHGEVMVGDREFWITRPYRSWQLIAAKLAAILLCIDLPFLIAQLYRIHQSGIPFSASILPALFLLHLFYFGVCTFPAAVIASITETLTQWLLVILGIALFAISMTWFPWNELPASFDGDEQWAIVLGGIVIYSILLTVLLLQYLRRRVRMARLCFVLAVVTVPLTILLASASWIRHMAYPELMDAQVIQFKDARIERNSFNPLLGEQVWIRIHGEIAGNRVVKIEGVRIHLSDDRGWQWSSPWTADQGILHQDNAGEVIQLVLPAKFRMHLDDPDLHLQIEFLENEYAFDPVQRIDTSAERFILPDKTYCQWKKPNEDSVRQFWPYMECSYVYQTAPVTKQVLHSEENTCAEQNGSTVLPPNHIFTEVQFGSGGRSDSDVDPDPVHSFDLRFGKWSPAIEEPLNNGQTYLEDARVCSGTPIYFQTGHFVRRGHLSVDFGQVKIEQYEDKKKKSGDDEEPDLGGDPQK
jgi:hypothetical protein